MLLITYTGSRISPFQEPVPLIVCKHAKWMNHRTLKPERNMEKCHKWDERHLSTTRKTTSPYWSVRLPLSLRCVSLCLPVSLFCICLLDSVCISQSICVCPWPAPPPFPLWLLRECAHPLLSSLQGHSPLPSICPSFPSTFLILIIWELVSYFCLLQNKRHQSQKKYCVLEENFICNIVTAKLEQNTK